MGGRRRLLAAAMALLLVMLSGCSQPNAGGPPSASTGSASSSSSPPNSPTSPPLEGFDVWKARLELHECSKAPLIFVVDGGDVRPHLPEGFTPTGPGGERFAQVTLHILNCQSLVIDNKTVLLSVRLAMTTGLVRVNDTLRGESAHQWYVFEMFTDNATVQEVFARAGFPVQPAMIQLAYSATQTEASVAVERMVWYETKTTHTAIGNSSTSDPGRWFRQSQGSAVVWADFNEVYYSPGFADPVALTVQDGFLKNLKPADSGHLTGYTIENLSSGSITFGRL